MIRFKSYIRGVLIAVLLCIGLPSVFALIACSKSVEQVKEICIFDLPQYSELKKNYGVEYEKWKSKCKDNYEFNFFKNMKVSFFPGGCSGRRKPMQSKLITESKKIDDVVVYIWQSKLVKKEKERMGIGGGIDYYTIRLTDMNDNAWEFNSYDYYHKDTNERYVYTLESDYNKFLLGRYDYETLEVETQRD